MLEPIKNKRVALVPLAFLIIPVLLACVREVTPTQPQTALVTPTLMPGRDKTEVAPASLAWKEAWDKTLVAARQEGKVVVFSTAGGAQTAALRQGFKQAYGLDVEFVSGRGSELREKLFRERRAGLYLADAWMAGAMAMVTELKPEGALYPLRPQLALPEVVDPGAWWGSSPIYADKEQTHVIVFCFFPRPSIVVNSDTVRPDAIKSGQDLLDPTWKGRIVIDDPTVTGPGQEVLHVVYKMLGTDFVRNLAQQDPVMSRDFRQATEWVARGKYPILIGPQASPLAELMAAGAPLRFLWLPGIMFAGGGPGSVGLINRAAHPNAAKVYINWLLSREGQTAYSKSFSIQSAREDVPVEHLNPEMVRQPGVTYMNVENEDIYRERPAVTKEVMKILGLTSN